MNGITYRNTITTIPGVSNTIHISEPRGYAYEIDTHFVHFYGRESLFFPISIGLGVIEKKSGNLNEWVRKTFGAEDIKPLNQEVGHAIAGVWRPSLYYNEDIFQALQVTETEMRLAEQALRLLLEKLDELFLYIEPDNVGLSIYSHKTRELLILACTEVENYWKYYMNKASALPISGKYFTTKDYVRLVDKLFLKEYEFKIKTYTSIPPIIPFENWNKSNPTISLPWYDAYNKTKHDRETYFSEATLLNCILAVVANLVLHCVKFSPFPMFYQNNVFSSIINQHFEAKFIGCLPESFYLHKLNLPISTRHDLIAFDAKRNGYALPFTTDPLFL